jgi:hypothetical protein
MEACKQKALKIPAMYLHFFLHLYQLELLYLRTLKLFFLSRSFRIQIYLSE